MKNEGFVIPDENAKLIEEAYKKLYLKSRSYNVDSKIEDAALEKVVEEKFYAAIEKSKEQGLSITDDETYALLNDLKIKIGKWKIDMEK